MEMFALQAAMRLPREDMAEPLVTNNISESCFVWLFCHFFWPLAVIGTQNDHDI